jgi:hypothetical protein
MQEKGLEAKSQVLRFHALAPTLRARKDLLDRCRWGSLIMQHKKIFLCQGAEADACMDLGLATTAAEVGDVVCPLRGSKVPYILRSFGHSSVRWRIIGQCYLDGWMYGEPPESRDWKTGENERFHLV